MSAVSPQEVFLKDYQANPFIVESVHLNVNLFEEHTVVKCILALKRNPDFSDKNAALKLDGVNLELQRVAIDERELTSSDYVVDEKKLVINTVPDNFILETHVKIYPHKNKALMGLYQSRSNFCTQCEAEGFRHITYYFDRPDVLSYFTTTITADKEKYPYLLSNGNLIDEKTLEGGRHWVKWEDPSLKPCYLFALVAGDFDVINDSFKTMSGRDVALRFFLEKGCGDQSDFAMQSLKRAMKWDEETWGREYDLDIYMVVAVSDFNMGAMENKGLNIFNTKYVLAQPEMATDTDYTGIEAVIGHEYFHNWSGNRVTCRDWFQITLKEGLTVFRDQCFTEDMSSKAVSRLDVVSIVRDRQFKEDSGPMSHPIRPESYIEINNFYTMTVYRKGSEVIRMVQTLLSPPVFRKAMDEYFRRFDGQAVTTEDFIEVMEDVSSKDLSQFKNWYSQSGTPILDIVGHYDESTQKFILNVKQSCPATPGQPHKKPFYLPLSVGLLNASGDEIKSTDILIVDKEEQSFTFDNLSKPPIPSLLRGFSAPVKLHYPYSDEELALLWVNDTDPFARWNAGQQFLTRCVLKMIDDRNQGWPTLVNPLLEKAFQDIITDGPEDLSFRARLLMMPQENYIHNHMTIIDVHGVYEMRKVIKHKMAEVCEHLFKEAYVCHSSKSDYLYNTSEVGRRSFANICLSYLTEIGKDQYFNLAYDQFKNSNNMTDSMGALLALNNHDCYEREQAFSEFYDRWHDNLLVVNKWLYLQATSRNPNVYDKVLQLMESQAFDINNPNNVYALLGGFGENHLHFHDVSGRGYQFIADQVLKIQSNNPQVAARVIQPLTFWKQYPNEQAQLMRAQLQRIAESNNLSSDIFEIVNKSLKDG